MVTLYICVHICEVAQRRDVDFRDLIKDDIRHLYIRNVTAVGNQHYLLRLVSLYQAAMLYDAELHSVLVRVLFSGKHLATLHFASEVKCFIL